MAITFTPLGQAVPQLQDFDAAMQAFMEQCGIRGTQLAVVREGRLVYSRAFTLAAAGAPLVKPTTLFRIASLSKLLTSIGIHRLIHEGHLPDGLQTKAYSILPKTLPPHAPGGDVAALDEITIDQLLSHTAGIDREIDYLAVADAFGHGLPLSDRAEVARYMRTRPLHTPANASAAYSNVAYILLGHIIDLKAPIPDYASWMRREIFQGLLGLARPRIAESLLRRMGPDEVWREPIDPRPAPSVVTADGELVANGYGNGDDRIYAAAGGWTMTAADYAKVLAALDAGGSSGLLPEALVTSMWSQPDKTQWSYARGWELNQWITVAGEQVRQHGGMEPGAAAYAAHRADGTSIVACFNREAPGDFVWPNGAPEKNHSQHWHDIASSITTWPDHDLFPTLGIPPVQGRSVYIANRGDARVLDVEKASTAPGTKVIAQPRATPAAPNQTWQVRQALWVTYGRLVSRLNALTLHVEGAQAAPGAGVVTWPGGADPAPQELWALVPDPAGGITIRSRLNQLVLQVDAGATTPAGRPVTTAAKGAPAAVEQRWDVTGVRGNVKKLGSSFNPDPMRRIRLASQAAKLALDVHEGKRISGTPVRAHPGQTPAALNQQWDFIPVETVTYFTLESSLGGTLMLDASGAIDQDGTPAIVWPGQNPVAVNHLWTFGADDGTIQSRLPGRRVLDVDGTAQVALATPAAGDAGQDWVVVAS